MSKHKYLSILDFLADLLSTSISVDKMLFISLVGICHTSASTCQIIKVKSYDATI